MATLTCCVCGGRMQKSATSAPQGVAMHRGCKPNGGHGLDGKYQAGCRCDLCREGKSARAREYNLRTKQESGVSYTSAWKRKKRGASLDVNVCVYCGEPMLYTNPGAAAPMHKACKESPDGRRMRDRERRRAAGLESTKVRAFRRKIERAAEGTSGGERRFIQGACQWCGAAFLAPHGVFCSDRCKGRMKSHKRSSSKGAFSMTPAGRAALYERDGWTCQICFLPVSDSSHHLGDLSPTVDHVVPQSLGGGHEMENLRLTHRWCNSKRSDTSWFTDEQVREAAVVRFGNEFSKEEARR